MLLIPALACWHRSINVIVNMVKCARPLQSPRPDIGPQLMRLRSATRYRWWHILRRRDRPAMSLVCFSLWLHRRCRFQFGHATASRHRTGRMTSCHDAGWRTSILQLLSSRLGDAHHVKCRVAAGRVDAFISSTSWHAAAWAMSTGRAGGAFRRARYRLPCGSIIINRAVVTET